MIERFGIEIEGICQDYPLLIKRLALEEKNWIVGEDLSVRIPSYYWHSFEIKSGIFSNLELFVEQLRKVIIICKQLRCRVTHKSGLHVHVSSPQNNVNRNFLVNARNEEKFYQNKKRERSYASPKYTGKQSTIGLIENNHIEVRAFDSALNIRHIVRSVKRSIEIYRRLVAVL